MSEVVRRLTEDVANIQKLGDNPRTDNGMDAAELKAWFDKAPEAIKSFLNESMIPDIERKFRSQDEWADTVDEAINSFVKGEGFVPLDGSQPMTGDLNMSGHHIVGVGSPAEPAHAANKDYVDQVGNSARGYTDTNMRKALCNANLETDYPTVLEACMNAPEAGGTFFAVVGSALAAAEDSAWKDMEVQYLVMNDSLVGLRKTVLAFKYSSACKIKTRTLFSGAWLGNWDDVDDVSSILSISRGGTGATTAAAAFSALSKTNADGYWESAPTGISCWKYEGHDPDAYNIPSRTCFVLVMKEMPSRGAAIAFEWHANGGLLTWRNYLHDDTESNRWGTWRALLGQILDPSLYSDTFPANAVTGQLHFVKG